MLVGNGKHTDHDHKRYPFDPCVSWHFVMFLRSALSTGAGGPHVPHGADLSNRGGKGNAMLLEAYGAYGISSDPDLNSHRLSLLDRGFVCALLCCPHPRRGGELGEYWHMEGMLLNKRNTFTDVIAVVEYLIQVTAIATLVSLPVARSHFLIATARIEAKPAPSARCCLS